MLASEGDYIAHRKLWSFLVDRMAIDLKSVGIGRPDEWNAHLFTYRKGDPPDDVTAFLRMTVEAGLAYFEKPQTLVLSHRVGDSLPE
jgi:hypothetical protein